VFFKFDLVLHVYLRSFRNFYCDGAPIEPLQLAFFLGIMATVQNPVARLPQLSSLRTTVFHRCDRQHLRPDRLTPRQHRL